GLFGPLVIDEPHPPFTYDREEILLFNDWFLKTSEEILAELVKPGAAMVEPMKKPGDESPGKMAGEMPRKMPEKMQMSGQPDVGDVPFESILFNGRGRFTGDDDAPLAKVSVKRGEVVRLRLINGSTTYALRFQIDGHRLTVVMADGAPIKPIEVDNLLIHVGERYDVLLTADQSGAAWIRAATLAGGEGRAVLHYDDTPGAQPPREPAPWGGNGLKPGDLRSPSPVTLAENPQEIRLRLGGSMMPYRWTINDEEYPKAEPIRLKTGEQVRFVLENPTGMSHPFHLHGHYFHVLGAPDALNLTDPPQKDTVSVPVGGTLVLAWQATNPGHWFFHCHIEWHAATGMARVVEIG
ncbi:MAG TPA: multicopper oxidase domain-containing protein, partial [Pirellulales bacterium]|nr:multicopper oxidase domain-containing protein [Pirellulales bacterium]